MLGDRASIDTAGTCQPDAALGQLFARELVGAGADRLYEAKSFRLIEKLVSPQPGDHQHVGLPYALLQGLGVADREAVDAGVERREPLLQPISNMGKADDDFFSSGDHGP